MSRFLSVSYLLGLFSKPRFISASARLLPLVLLSLFLHLAGLWYLGLTGPVEYGTSAKMRNPGWSELRLVAHLVGNDDPPSQGRTLANETPALANRLQGTDERPEAHRAAESNSLNDGRQDYVASGKLTRLPFPLADIDLNETAIDDVAIEGVVELTIWIDVDGKVAKISTAVENENARLFADRIAARFFSARFSPGEIDGKAVNSEFKITVVSEPITSGPDHF